MVLIVLWGCSRELLLIHEEALGLANGLLLPKADRWLLGMGSGLASLLPKADT